SFTRSGRAGRGGRGYKAKEARGVSFRSGAWQAPCCRGRRLSPDSRSPPMKQNAASRRLSKIALGLATASAVLLGASATAHATSARGAVLLRGNENVVVAGGANAAAPQHNVF